MFCQKCGAEIGDNDKFCCKCGNSVIDAQEEADKEQQHQEKKIFEFLSSIGTHISVYYLCTPRKQKVIVDNHNMEISIDDKKTRIIPINKISNVLLSFYIPLQMLIIILICALCILAGLGKYETLTGCILLAFIICFVVVTMRNRRIRIVEENGEKTDLIVRKSDAEKVGTFVTILKDELDFKGSVTETKDMVQIILYCMIAFVFLISLV